MFTEADALALQRRIEDSNNGIGTPPTLDEIKEALDFYREGRRVPAPATKTKKTAAKAQVEQLDFNTLFNPTGE